MSRLVAINKFGEEPANFMMPSYFETSETMKTKWASLEKLEQQTILKIIVGEAGMSAFDEFVNNWTSAGDPELFRSGACQTPQYHKILREHICRGRYQHDLYRAHPDWALAIPGREPNRARNQLVLDMRVFSLNGMQWEWQKCLIDQSHFMCAPSHTVEIPVFLTSI